MCLVLDKLKGVSSLTNYDLSKYSVIANMEKDWEYRCNKCKQLRFSPEYKPTVCMNCGSTNINIGKPGELEVL